jgi:hypothetical protein
MNIITGRGDSCAVMDGGIMMVYPHTSIFIMAVGNGAEI